MQMKNYGDWSLTQHPQIQWMQAITKQKTIDIAAPGSDKQQKLFGTYKFDSCMKGVYGTYEEAAF